MATYGQKLLSQCAVRGTALSDAERAHLHGDELIQYATLGYDLGPGDVDRLDEKLLPRYEALRKGQAVGDIRHRPR